MRNYEQEQNKQDALVAAERLGFGRPCWRDGVWCREVVLTIEEVADLVARLETAEDRARDLPRSIQENTATGLD